MQIQGTKPQTLAYGLTDSPVGLAAWIVEKFRTWSDCGGDVERRFSKDVLLTNVMLYWVTGAIGSSFWPYYARQHSAWPIGEKRPVTVPTAYASFPREISIRPAPWAERVYNIPPLDFDAGWGHFAALEEPEALGGRRPRILPAVALRLDHLGFRLAGRGAEEPHWESGDHEVGGVGRVRRAIRNGARVFVGSETGRRTQCGSRALPSVRTGCSS